MESVKMNLKKLILKIVRVIILIMQWELDEKKYENILLYDILQKTTFMGSVPLGCVLGLIK